ncbi:hypothetical protein SAMN02787142_4319 [Burkholderia sp. WP9]|uniref:hypothetical protein n=1 Tax=Burkholderia sp. WP9 TaxID=1500263 RepID=UPI000896C004|nr:hypothetical protein [Burkholderia sp. WP9]SEE00514.1 hypothetical protein SAMN02787142_4319 [Burkholderia sp. WP9]
MIGPAMAARAKNVLMTSRQRPYTFHSAETTADEIGVSINVGGQAASNAAIFSSVAPLHVFYGRALAGEPSGSPVPTFRYANPVMRPLTPIGVGKRASTINVGGRYMRPVSARTEQTLSPTELANRALRAAALAPTVFDALDICADALQALAALAVVVPMEGARHV